MAGSTILRDMGAGWLECQDAQGIFYHNQATQECSDTMPQQLMAAMAPAPAMQQQQQVQQMQQVQQVQQVQQQAEAQPAVLRELAANWLECQDGQGIFYFNQLTKQSSDTLPAELMVAAAPMAAPMMMAAPAPAAGAAQTLRELPGNWLECQDEQGIFFFNQATQQSSDTLPAELAGLEAMVAPQMIQAAPVTIQAAPASYTPVQMPQQPYVQQVSAAAPSYTPVQQISQPQYVQQAPPSYLPAPVTQQQYMQTQPQVAAAPASYTPAPISQQQYMQQVQQASSYLPPQAATTSYLPAPVSQQQYMQQAGQPQPQVVYQQAQPQVVQAQPQVLQAQAPQVVQAQPQVMYQQSQQQVYGAPQVMQAATQAQPIVQAQAAAQAGARKKSAFGDWVVYEDAQGEFFMQASTGQQFTTPPPAMVQSYQAHKAAGLVVP